MSCCVIGAGADSAAATMYWGPIRLLLDGVVCVLVGDDLGVLLAAPPLS